MIRLRDLLEHRVSRKIETEFGATWVACRPLPGPFRWRLRDAWAVLTGRADALTWPEEGDPETWCSIPSHDEIITIDEHGTVSPPGALARRPV